MGKRGKRWGVALGLHRRRAGIAMVVVAAENADCCWFSTLRRSILRYARSSLLAA
jgi:hypothetical protein